MCVLFFIHGQEPKRMKILGESREYPPHSTNSPHPTVSNKGHFLYHVDSAHIKERMCVPSFPLSGSNPVP